MTPTNEQLTLACAHLAAWLTEDVPPHTIAWYVSSVEDEGVRTLLEGFMELAETT